jgi:hypothetical protein
MGGVRQESAYWAVWSVCLLHVCWHRVCRGFHPAYAWTLRQASWGVHVCLEPIKQGV